MTDQRLTRADRCALMIKRREQRVLHAALEEARAVGYLNMRRDGIAKRAGMGAGSVSHAFGDMETLRDKVMALAIETGEMEIIRQGLANAHPLAQSAPLNLRYAALL